MPQADKVSWRFRRLLDNFFSSRPQKQHRQHVEQQGEGAQAYGVEEMGSREFHGFYGLPGSRTENFVLSCHMPFSKLKSG
jgi:hypothetical protein